MATHKLFLLPGDGIGPEVMGEVRRVIQWFQDKGIASFELDEGLVGGAAYDAHGESISDADMEKAMAADAIMFGAVGGPKWDTCPLRQAPRGRPAAPAQGPRPVRQSAPGDLLSGAGRCLVAEVGSWSKASTS